MKFKHKLLQSAVKHSGGVVVIWACFGPGPSTINSSEYSCITGSIDLVETAPHSWTMTPNTPANLYNRYKEETRTLYNDLTCPVKSYKSRQ